MITGGIGILGLLLSVCIGLPVGIALLFVATVGLLCLSSLEQTFSLSAPMFYNFIGRYEFSVIPMFVLMGNIGFHSGLFTQIFETARKWAGRLPAGLAVAVVIGQTIFGACTGSNVAACVVIGRSAIPIMRKMKYPDDLATGVVAGSGTLAVLIPPSVTICIYGILVNESIGKLLIAGILPGLLSAAIFITLVMIQSRSVPRDPTRYSLREKMAGMSQLWVIAVLILAITGGIYSGISTATEAGALGAFVMFMLALVSRRVSWTMIFKSVSENIVTSGMILITIVGAVLFARFLTVSGFSHGMTEWIQGANMPRLVVFLFVCCVYLFLGCFVSSIGMMVMTLPSFYPLMMSLGYDPIWFCIIVVIMCEIAFITPPVGINLFAVKSVAGDVPLATIIRGVVPFIFRDLLVIAILYVFPGIVTFLPGKM